MVTKEPDYNARKQARYAARVKEQSQARADLFAETVTTFEGRLMFNLQPVAGVDGAVGITIGAVDPDTLLPEMDAFARERGFTLEELLDLVGEETGRRVKVARGDNVQVSVVGKATGGAADYD